MVLCFENTIISVPWHCCLFIHRGTAEPAMNLLVFHVSVEVCVPNPKNLWKQLVKVLLFLIGYLLAARMYDLFGGGGSRITNQYVSSPVVMNTNIFFKSGTARSSLNSENSGFVWTYWHVFERQTKRTGIFLSSTVFTLTIAWHLLM